jgi:hypothetical protein
VEITHTLAHQVVMQQQEELTLVVAVDQYIQEQVEQVDQVL